MIVSLLKCLSSFWQAAASCYIDLIIKESDNNVKLIVLDRLIVTSIILTPAHVVQVLQVCPHNLLHSIWSSRKVHNNVTVDRSWSSKLLSRTLQLMRRSYSLLCHCCSWFCCWFLLPDLYSWFSWYFPYSYITSRMKSGLCWILLDVSFEYVLHSRFKSSWIWDKCTF